VIELFKMLLRRFEGVFLKPYLCPAGVPTIGVGATTYEDGTPVKLSDPPITVERADQLLESQALTYLDAVTNISPVLLDHHERHVGIADFAYNLGTTRYKASTLRKRVEAEDWEGAASEMMKWVWGGGRKLPGLVKRRTVDANLLLTD
jgi:lysozyme